MKLSQERRNFLESATSLYQRSVGLARPYLEARGFTWDTVSSFRLGVVGEEVAQGDDNLVGRLSIPYITGAGVVDQRFRCLRHEDCNAVGCPKYLGRAGYETRLFGVRSLFRAERVIAVCEGELDAVSLVQCGIPAVAVPGVENWKPHYSRLFADFSRVLVLGDGDSAGRKFGNRMADLMGAIPIRLPDGMDCNGVMCDNGMGPDYLRRMVA